MQPSECKAERFFTTLDRFRNSTESTDVYSDILDNCLPPDLVGSSLIENARSTASLLHRNAVRYDGSPYFVHPQRVAILAACYDFEGLIDRELLIAGALLHDVVEDTCVPPVWLERNFSVEIAELVSLVSAKQVIVNETKEQRRQRKMEKYSRMASVNSETFIVYALDLLDNAISWNFISSGVPAFSKIARWIYQAQYVQLPLIWKREPKIAEVIEDACEQQKQRGIACGGWMGV